jgi:acetyltransferase-like isoleucine patch superfamily enzyme
VNHVTSALLGDHSQVWRVRVRKLHLRFRIFRFQLLSDQPKALAGSVQQSAVVVLGRGRFELAGTFLGYWPSPRAFDGVIHLEARHATARIRIGSGTYVNNGAVIISERGAIDIGERVLIGPDVTVLDSNFHAIDPYARSQGSADSSGMVKIGDDVFIGQGVTILKGVTVGDRSVIGAGSVVIDDIPPDTVAAGNPCRVIRVLDRTVNSPPPHRQQSRSNQ